MTLIAFATYGDRAEFITDTASYTRYVESMGRTTKHLTLNHIDTAVLAQGDSLFGDYVQVGALQAGGQAADYDQLVDDSQEWVSRYWCQVRDDAADPDKISDSAIFFIGWSNRHQAFTAHALDSADGFVPRRIRSAWVTPSPFTYRPSRIEARRAREWMDDADDARTEEHMARWQGRPVLQAPGSVAEWVELAKTVRDQRALESYLRVIVAGQVIHTRLERGAVTSRVVHEFTDAGEEFQQLIAFTKHPQAQTMPCWCESGKRFVDCHLAPTLDEPCGCRSGQTFRECCAVAS